MTTDNIAFSSAQDRINVATGTAGLTSTATISGNLQVDYTNLTVSGSITDSNNNTYSNFTLAVVNGSYVLTSAPSTGAAVGALAYTLAVSYPSNVMFPNLVSTASKSVANNTSATTDNVPVTSTRVDCFLTGTRIRTARGEVVVEALRVGDVAVTATGNLRRIIWIGYREMNLRRSRASLPVRIFAHAFGPHLPERDLMLSPGHPVLVGADDDGEGGYLVPIMCLVNGTTIERVAVDEATYWHIELDAHDILLAEGLPAESYIDMGSRPWFAGADGALYDPDMALPGMPSRCRPVAIDGPIVEAERRRLDQVFETRLASAAAWPEEASAVDWAAA